MVPRVTVRLTRLLRHDPSGPSGRVTDLICEAAGANPRVIGRVLGGTPIAPGGGPEPHGVWLVRDVLDVQIVDRDGRHCGRVGEVLLEQRDGGLFVAAVVTGIRPVLERCGLAWIWPGAPSRMIAWREIRRQPGRAHAYVAPAAPRRRYRGVLRARRHAPS